MVTSILDGKKLMWIGEAWVDFKEDGGQASKTSH